MLAGRDHMGAAFISQWRKRLLYAVRCIADYFGVISLADL